MLIQVFFTDKIHFTLKTTLIINTIIRGAEELHDISENMCVIPNTNVWFELLYNQTTKNFLFTKNAIKPNIYCDIVELSASLQDEGHENDKKDPLKQMYGSTCC